MEQDGIGNNAVAAYGLMHKTMFGIYKTCLFLTAHIVPN